MDTPITLSIMYKNIENSYHSFKEVRIKERTFSYELWLNLIEEWKKSPMLSVSEIGKTYEGEPIHQVVFGKGPIHICAWSQMHGDEATATMALADIFLFLSGKSHELSEFREKLHQKITLYVIPRLNADGAKRWTRETALGIDMNRDAIKKNSPEAKILNEWAQKIKPAFSFNLHDQHRLYSVGNTPHQTHIALLATTGDESGTWTDSRLRAGKLANRLAQIVEKIYPNKIAKWTDEYNQRAFGDYFQAQGFGLLLLESGGAGWDLEKQSLRKTNACLLLDAFYAIATEEWKNENLQTYESLLTNERNIFDIKLLNAPLRKNDINVRSDIGLNICEEYANGKITFMWTLEEIGDLNFYTGLTEIDASNYQLSEPAFFEKGKNYTSLRMTNNGGFVFDLTHYTNKINK
jgi:Zinc carboxypeptidase